ncbi:catabolite gene activator and regulatory subunit of cAMP-dependent protein kinase [Thermosipho africanus TCF52B]|jgi:CRP-like cAMP-binding protein|uniref:Catabolite gene activator and regulatory subunit of cAMP-dependent protein kinase n=1 Tax=Thermosipho africanus (strain TCF52B) TaxID=484019 RepID=B7IEE1_THEAB|nr:MULTISPECIES: Crp/Fnr family transcriptional regulator [Thermosipho]ACJ76368.1 catabolite gene activator and regulatory subunit of cAMP-dependent protein kinase [Thermosipho africanus TCF52B]MBZ4649610.1 catabolite activator and regulatory subunit of cAMP-dependent protein kinase [Thermosipho sp. (in: thermotogales)]MDK2839970.1 family transcriptional regulator, cyclic receptor protein [Thermosipho sp. (in: thermotogales)]
MEIFSYESIFDKEKQNELRNVFLALAKKGKQIEVGKNCEIELSNESSIAIVVEGKLKQSLTNKEGLEKILFYLQPGEIFGEVDYFGETKFNTITIAVVNSKISILEKKIIEEQLTASPILYRYFMKSIIRKLRIIEFQMLNMTFNDSIGRISNTLLRLAAQQGIKKDGKVIINFPLTQQELANIIGCSRITVTRTFKDLISKGIISIKNKKIIIKNLKELEKLDKSF